MVSTTEVPNLPVADPADKEHYPLNTGRTHAAVRKLIDRAALEADQSRAAFLLRAAFEKAFVTLGADEARRVLEAA